jgi:hypothetical protein
MNLLRRFSTYTWSWTCNADWMGKGNFFHISIPISQDYWCQKVDLSGMVYNKERKAIEIWGSYIPKKIKCDIPV